VTADGANDDFSSTNTSELKLCRVFFSLRSGAKEERNKCRNNTRAGLVRSQDLLDYGPILYTVGIDENGNKPSKSAEIHMPLHWPQEAARTANMTSEDPSESALKAVLARWKKLSVQLLRDA
jgi:hypothetical protein